jgi:hypothetical protein
MNNLYKLALNKNNICRGGFVQNLAHKMNNLYKPALFVFEKMGGFISVKPIIISVLLEPAPTALFALKNIYGKT